MNNTTNQIGASLVAQMVKNPPVNARDWVLPLCQEDRSLREGNGNVLQYSSLENSMDRGTWWATVHGVAKSWTWQHACTHTHTPQPTWPDIYRTNAIIAEYTFFSSEHRTFINIYYIVDHKTNLNKFKRFK